MGSKESDEYSYPFLFVGDQTSYIHDEIMILLLSRQATKKINIELFVKSTISKT